MFVDIKYRNKTNILLFHRLTFLDNLSVTLNIFASLEPLKARNHVANVTISTSHILC